MEVRRSPGDKAYIHDGMHCAINVAITTVQKIPSSIRFQCQTLVLVLALQSTISFTFIPHLSLPISNRNIIAEWPKEYHYTSTYCIT